MNVWNASAGGLVGRPDHVRRAGRRHAGGCACVVAGRRPDRVASIAVEGNRRVEVETIRSYFKPGPGGRLDQAADRRRPQGADRDRPVPGRANQPCRAAGSSSTVVENPVIGRIAFEGNKKVKDEQLSAEIQSKPRGTLSRPMVQSDAQRIAEIYRRSGRYDVRVTPEDHRAAEQPRRPDLHHHRRREDRRQVDRVRRQQSPIRPIACKDVIKTRESNLLSFLGGADVYDPDRVEADRDLIRRFYLKNGFADVQVVAALTEYDPEKKGFLVTFKIEEGQQYRVALGRLPVAASRRSTPTRCAAISRVNVGSLYNAEALEKSVEEMQIEASRRGYAFAIVRPRGDRNFETAHRLDRLRGRRRPAHLYRAHQRPRQHPHPRLRDPPRVRSLRRRRLQPRAGRPRRAPAEESRLLQDREDRHRARLVERSRDPDRRSRREIDRRLLGLGRLFDHRRRAGRSQHLRAQLPRPRPVRQGVGDLRPVCARLLAVVRRAVSAGLSRRARPRPLPAPAARQQLHLLRHQDARLQPAARLRPARGSGAAAALFDLSAGNPAAEPAGEL